MHSSKPASELSAIYRKIDWRLLPFLLVCYFVAYLDRVNVGFAKLQMQSDLNLSDAAYGLGAGIFLSATPCSRHRAICCCPRSALARPSVE